LLERRAEGVVHRFFGGVEVAEDANQRRQHATRFRRVNVVDYVGGAVGGVHSPPIRPFHPSDVQGAWLAARRLSIRPPRVRLRSRRT
jgi:hypothetical protein